MDARRESSVAGHGSDAGGIGKLPPSAKVLGRVEPEVLGEISGLATSRAHDGVIWVHNDSGADPVVYALHRTGRLLGEFVLQAAAAVDWEDMAICPGSVRDHLFIGDIGDNRRRRESITVYVVPEPVVRTKGRAVRALLEGVAAFELVYPRGARYNAEALLCDPRNGDLYIVTKEASGPVKLFRARAPLSQSERSTLEEVATIRLTGFLTAVTGGDVSPDGSGIILRTYSDIFYWDRPEGDLAAAFSQAPRKLPSVAEEQGEAIAFTSDGRGYMTVSEGTKQPIYHFAFPPQP